MLNDKLNLGSQAVAIKKSHQVLVPRRADRNTLSSPLKKSETMRSCKIAAKSQRRPPIVCALRTLSSCKARTLQHGIGYCKMYMDSNEGGTCRLV